ncbi:hypothetical protein [Algiphilus sp.]|uniref:hypothetical protein n=1 Tax=Algiphilus sp. TaxID=1872431 RepID=UPI0032EF81DC
MLTLANCAVEFAPMTRRCAVAATILTLGWLSVVFDASAEGRPTLRVEGYLQPEAVTTLPHASDCAVEDHSGRLVVDALNDQIYICTDNGWVLPQAGLGNDSITAAAIASDAVGEDEIATDAVNSDELAPEAVSAKHLSDGAVEQDSIATSAVGSDAIADNAVGVSELAGLSGERANSSVGYFPATCGSTSVIPPQTVEVGPSGLVAVFVDVGLQATSGSVVIFAHETTAFPNCQESARLMESTSNTTERRRTDPSDPTGTVTGRGGFVVLDVGSSGTKTISFRRTHADGGASLSTGRVVVFGL